MIHIKNNEEIEKMRKAGRVVGDLLKLLEEKLRPGMRTDELDKIAYDFIVASGARPSFLGYGGFPASICVSIDEQVVHGFPSERIIKEGEIVSVDVGAELDGYNGDAARSFYVGSISPEKKKLIEVTKECFFKGAEAVMVGGALGDIGAAIQAHAEANGFSVVRDMVGHGIGREMHEDPSVPNYGMAGRGVKLKRNMTICVEPMINMGKRDVTLDDDGWTVRTLDGLPSAHYENTILIKDDGVEILTL